MPILRKVDHDYFSRWSANMCYILGFVVADGNLIKNKRGACFLSLEIIDRKLLLDIKNCLASDHKISLRKRERKHVFVRKERKTATSTLHTVFTSCSVQFLEELNRQLIFHGLSGGRIVQERNYYRLYYGVRDSRKLRSGMFYANLGLHLERKKKVFDAFFDKNAAVA